MKIKDLKALVIDHGQFWHIANRLAEDMAKVYYWTPTERAMPLLADGIVGDGFDSVERVLDFWEVVWNCDLVVFPDVGFGGLQRHLASQGFPVWGHMGGDVLETHRGRHLNQLEELGMDVPPYQVVKGMSSLKLLLMDAEDKYIKISKWRGDWETFHWRSWCEDESALDQAAYHLGPAKELMTFYVFDAIDTDIEDGIDTYCINGQWPSLVLHGMEHKDKSFIGAMQKLSTISQAVTIANDKFGPVLKEFGYRGAFSSEMRIKDEFSYFIDPTCRFPSPPSQVQTKLWGNFSDIIWRGANGECIDPEPTATFGAQVLLSVKREKEEWVTLSLSDELRPWVQPMFPCEIDGEIRIPPHPLENMVGWLTAIGDTLEECIGNLQTLAKLLPCGVDCDVTSLAHLLQEMEAAKEEDVVIAEEIPEPATVLEEA